MNNIGIKIKELRKKHGLTQEHLADALGVTYKSVSKWECGTTVPDLALIVPLAKILHISTDELLGMTVAEDSQRQKYNEGLQKYRGCEANQLSYAWARAALLDFPDDYRYMEWLAYTEYLLAFEENKNGGSADFFEEMTENALRRYETILGNCTDSETIRLAAMGKVMVLRLCERSEEAEWSAEFEYPDPQINTAEAVLSLSPAGMELLALLKEEHK